MQRQEKRQEKKQIKVWEQRIARRALAHGVSKVNHLSMYAHNVYWHNTLKLGSSRYFTGDLPERACMGDLLKDGTLSARWLSELTYIWYNDDYVNCYYIPMTSIGMSDEDTLYRANYKYIEETFADLLDYEVLIKQDGLIYVDVDRVYWNRARLEDLADALHNLDDFSILDEGLYSELQSENEAKTVKDCALEFVSDLNIAPHILPGLIMAVTGETSTTYKARMEHKQSWKYYETRTDEEKCADDRWEAFVTGHMWDLINQYEFDFDEDGTYLDLEKLVKVSPLKNLGQAVIDNLYELASDLDSRLYVGLDEVMHTPLYEVIKDLHNQVLTVINEAE